MSVLFQFINLLIWVISSAWHVIVPNGAVLAILVTPVYLSLVMDQLFGVVVGEPYVKLPEGI